MNILNSSKNVCVIEKMDFEGVEDVFNAMFFAFHPNDVTEENGADIRFVSLWTLFLASVGWAEDEYWEEVSLREMSNPNPDLDDDSRAN